MLWLLRVLVADDVTKRTNERNPYFRYYLPNPLPCVLRGRRGRVILKNSKAQLKISNMGEMGKKRNATVPWPQCWFMK